MTSQNHGSTQHEKILMLRASVPHLVWKSWWLTYFYEYVVLIRQSLEFHWRRCVESRPFAELYMFATIYQAAQWPFHIPMALLVLTIQISTTTGDMSVNTKSLLCSEAIAPLVYGWSGSCQHPTNRVLISMLVVACRKQITFVCVAHVHAAVYPVSCECECYLHWFVLSKLIQCSVSETGSAFKHYLEV